MLHIVGFVLLFFTANLSANNLQQQIYEDLSFVGDHSFTNEELMKCFQELSKSKQVLYCKIRKNGISWKKSKIRNCVPRNQVIFQYFSKLKKKYTLPDMDFILCTEDGFHEDSKYPLFAFAANAKSKKNVCLFPDMEALEGVEKYINECRVYSNLYPWSFKLEKGFFRGYSTGKFDPSEEYFGNDRVKAIAFGYYHPDLLEADFTFIINKPIADYMKALGKSVKPSLPIKDHFAYKYLLDIDGYSCTYSRCRWILLSNSTLLKVSSDFIQWYYKCLIPYENYIPIKNDFSDLEQIFSWLKQEDQVAYTVAVNGQKLGEEIFSQAAIEDYIYQLLCFYSKKILIKK